MYIMMARKPITTVVKIGDIIYNSPLDINRWQEVYPMNFYNKKSKKIMSSIIIIILVLAMIVPTVAYLIQ